MRDATWLRDLDATLLAGGGQSRCWEPPPGYFTREEERRLSVLRVKEMYRIHQELGGKIVCDTREVITREELNKRVLDKIMLGDFDRLEVQFGPIITRIRRFNE
jgi:hypothetical protein